MTITPADTDESAVLACMVDALHALPDDCALDPGSVTMTSRFVDDLDLESVDLVTLTGTLRARYGERVDFPGYFASLDLDELAELTVGHLVRHIVASLR